MPIVDGNISILGSKLDASANETIYSHTKQVFTFLTNRIFVYPYNADGITISSGTSSYAWGAWTQVIPINTVASAFRIVGVYADNQENDDAIYHVQIGYNSGTPTLVTVMFRNRAAGGDHVSDKWLLNACPIIPANTLVQARCANAGAASAQDIRIKVFYQIAV